MCIRDSAGRRHENGLTWTTHPSVESHCPLGRLDCLLPNGFYRGYRGLCLMAEHDKERLAGSHLEMDCAAVACCKRLQGLPITRHRVPHLCRWGNCGKGEGTAHDAVIMIIEEIDVGSVRAPVAEIEAIGTWSLHIRQHAVISKSLGQCPAIGLRVVNSDTSLT